MRERSAFRRFGTGAASGIGGTKEKGVLFFCAGDALRSVQQKEALSMARLSSSSLSGTGMGAEARTAQPFSKPSRPGSSGCRNVRNPFISPAAVMLKARHREGLRHLLEFTLKRHPRYSLPPKRLKFIEAAIWKRASRLFDAQENVGSELEFW